MTDSPKELMTRKEAAAYMDFSCGTLAVWDSKGLYKLKTEKRGRKIFYLRSYIDKMMGDDGSGPMLNPKKAARYLGYSHRTLEGKQCLARLITHPARLGRSIRYRVSELDKYLQKCP